MSSRRTKPPPPETAPRADEVARTIAYGPSKSTAQTLAVRGFRLEVVEGPGVGASFESSGDRAGVGAHPSNDLVLDDETVSRFHCEIAIGTDGARVRDLGSMNGTVVDGVSVRDAMLRNESLVRLGASVVRFGFRAAPAKIALSTSTRFGSLFGHSAAMRAVFALLERAAQSNATVLLEGETGTGKGQAAASLHRASARASRPFVTLDCSAIPPNLIESELFGHEKGAFTTALRDRAGVFEAAAGGTVFLDEIGELPIDVQPKLLRVLEERHVRRVGSNDQRPIDVRVVAATNRNLRAEVNVGRFRSDLFFRLAILRIPMPSLRRRPEDIVPLVETLLESLGATSEESASLRTDAFLAQLTAASWPGNVRELRNCLERCLVFREARLDDDDAPEPSSTSAPGFTIDPTQPYAAARDHSLAQFERAYVEALLAHHAGKVTAAARGAGINRVYLYKLMRRHGVKAV